MTTTSGFDKPCLRKYEDGIVYYVSYHDLQKIPHFKEDMNKVEFAKLLWSLGMDVKRYEVKLVEDIHRALDNKIVACKRILGCERTDSKWLRSGHCSMAAMIFSSKDASHRKDLREMSAQGFQLKTTDEE